MERKDMNKYKYEKLLLGKRILGAVLENFTCTIHLIDKKNYPIYMTLPKDIECLTPGLTDMEIAKRLMEKHLNLTITKDSYVVYDFFKDSEKSFESIRRTKEYRLFKKLLENGMLS